MKQLERQVWISFVLIFMSFLPCFACLSKLLWPRVGIYITKTNGNVQWEARRMFSKNTEKILLARLHGILFSLYLFMCPFGPTVTIEGAGQLQPR